MLSRRSLLSGFLAATAVSAVSALTLVTGSSEAEAIVNPHRQPRAIAVHPHRGTRRRRRARRTPPKKETTNRILQFFRDWA